MRLQVSVCGGECNFSSDEEETQKSIVSVTNKCMNVSAVWRRSAEMLHKGQFPFIQAIL